MNQWEVAAWIVWLVSLAFGAAGVLTLALWGERAMMHRWFDVLETWRGVCEAEVSGRALDCGHYLAEEAPEETLAELTAFFGR